MVYLLQRYNFLSTKDTKDTKKILISCALCPSWTFLSLYSPVSKIHANEDEGRAEKEPKGDVLMKQPPGEEDGGDGIEVNPVRSDDRTKFADDPVPGEVTEHRGDDSQEEKIQNG